MNAKTDYLKAESTAAATVANRVLSRLGGHLDGVRVTPSVGFGHSALLFEVDGNFVDVIVDAVPGRVLVLTERDYTRQVAVDTTTDDVAGIAAVVARTLDAMLA